MNREKISFYSRECILFIDRKEYTKAIIIDYPWIDYILTGQKIWEMRSKSAKFRGNIAFIAKGTGMIVGVGELVDSLPKFERHELISNFDKHCVDYENHPELLKWCCAWVIKNAKPIKPTPYPQKRGAVVWVNI